MANDIYPPDYATPIGQLRLLLGDVTEPYVFSDGQIQAFIALNGDNLYYAASNALLVIASNETLTYKYVKTDDLTVDGAKTGAELRLQAAAWKAQGDAEDDAKNAEFFIMAYPNYTDPFRAEYEEIVLYPGVI